MRQVAFPEAEASVPEESSPRNSPDPRTRHEQGAGRTGRPHEARWLESIGGVAIRESEPTRSRSRAVQRKHAGGLAFHRVAEP
jgi:hypothetical protein